MGAGTSAAPVTRACRESVRLVHVAVAASPAAALSSSGFSTTARSAVSTIAAIDAAFCSAERVTLAGSMMPALTMSTHSPVAALKPVAVGLAAELLRR